MIGVSLVVLMMILLVMVHDEAPVVAVVVLGCPSTLNYESTQ